MKSVFDIALVFRKPALCMLLLVCSAYLYAQDAISLFDEYSNRIYQIRIIDQASGKQAALGSGFQVSAEGMIVTNYHVISEYINHPGRYRIEYSAYDGTKGDLRLIDIDVINDLSLLKRNGAVEHHLDIAEALPMQGESIYSLGNPHDLGLTVIPGTYNGIAAHSLYQRIHFSGSINPGMSGGPVLNSRGEVVGVNVATAGNQVSFLVPLNKLAALIDRSGRDAVDINDRDFNRTISKQLSSNQQKIISELVDKEWVTSGFRGVTVPNEIADYIRCWGLTDNDPDVLYESFTSICSQDESVYLSDSFTTGSIVYQFNWLESDRLNLLQFYNMYQTRIADVYPDNMAGKEDVSEFACHEDFVNGNASADRKITVKSTFCVRKYKKYENLYDVLYLGATVHEKNRGLISHFTLAGVSMDLALRFTEKFLSNITWN